MNIVGLKAVEQPPTELDRVGIIHLLATQAKEDFRWISNSDLNPS